MSYGLRAHMASLVAVALLAAGCSGAGGTLADSKALGPRSTQAVLAEARGAPAPAGVEDDVYGMLLDELERVLEQEGVTRVVAAPPSGLENRIADLTYNNDDLDRYTLSWSYTNSGDYDQNSEVNVADLTVIGQNFGKSSSDPDWETSARRADGDGDGLVTVADITPIGRHFGKSVGGYNVYRTDLGGLDPELIDGGEPVLIGTVDIDSITDPLLPIEFAVELGLDAPGGVYAENAPVFSVIPFDRDGEEPADTADAVTVAGDSIVIYNSSAIDDYRQLSWSQPEADRGVPQPPVSDWIHARVTRLTPDVQPPPKADQATYDFSGRALPQTMDARFNLSTGEGRIELRGENGSTLARYRGGADAFTVMQTAQVAADAPFSPDSLAATPFVIMNADPAALAIEEYTAGQTDYAGEMTGVQTMLGVFFPDDPLKISGMAGGLPEWAEKWCLIKDAVGEIEDLQEY